MLEGHEGARASRTLAQHGSGSATWSGAISGVKAAVEALEGELEKEAELLSEEQRSLVEGWSRLREAEELGRQQDEAA